MKNQRPFVSIIMPVYNGEQDIAAAIESIQKQTASDWELIIVDDCSKDQTQAVVQRFADEDSRIHLMIQEQNAGPGCAKNVGLDAAKGCFVTFADADDWLEADAFEKMSSCASEDFDVIIAGYYRDIYTMDGVVLEQSLVCSEGFRCTTRKETIARIPQMDENRLFSFAWNKFYRKEVIDRHKIRFSDKKFGEDYDFNIAFFKWTKGAIMMQEGFYHYIKKNTESLTERVVPDFFEINKDRFQKMKALMIENELYSGTIRECIMSAYIKHVLAAVSRLYDSRSGLPLRVKRDRTKMMLRDEMSIEALQYAKANNRKEQLCNAIFKLKNVTITMLFGKLLWFMQTKGKKIYERVK